MCLLRSYNLQFMDRLNKRAVENTLSVAGGRGPEEKKNHRGQTYR